MDLSTLRTLTRSLLNDNVNYEASSGFESAQAFSNDQYMDALNWAQEYYAMKTQATYVEVGATASATSTLTVPADCLGLVRVIADVNPTPPVTPLIILPETADLYYDGASVTFTVSGIEATSITAIISGDTDATIAELIDGGVYYVITTAHTYQGTAIVTAYEIGNPSNSAVATVTVMFP